MSSVLSNFVAVTKNRGDLLRSAEYRTIVEMIRTLAKRYQSTGIFKDYQVLLDHLQDYNDPHQDFKINFTDDIVNYTYTIYVNMLPTPLSLSDFKLQIASNLSFLELFRRIVINRLLYNQVKLSNGSVPSSASVYLSEDYGFFGVQPNPVSINFGSGITSETDFIRLGWNGNTTPYPIIRSAMTLSNPVSSLNSVFDISSSLQARSPSDIFSAMPAPIDLACNDFTLNLSVIGSPTADTALFSLQNSSDILGIFYKTDQTVLVKFNNNPLLQSTNPSSDGRVFITVDRTGTLILTTYQAGVKTLNTVTVPYTNPAPFNIVTVGVDYENIAIPGFGLRELTLYSGRVI